MDSEIEKIRSQLERLEGAVADIKELAGAIYERVEGGRERLERLRRSDVWRQAYSEPEPLVTVRIATWNRAELLVERALPSVFRQTYGHWEAVIVGDACTDDTAARLAAIDDPRVRFCNLPAHGPYPEHRVKRWMVAGVPAMNEGLRLARGRWIAPLDDDDYWEDDHLQVLLDAAREKDAEFVYGRARCTLEGEPLEKDVGAWPPRYGGIDLTASFYNAALREFEHEKASHLLGEGNDWNLVRRMWEAGVRFAFVDRVVATYCMDHLGEVMAQQRAERDGAGQ